MGARRTGRRRTDVDPVEYGFHFGQKIGMGEHYAFGVSRGTRGVKQRSQFIIIGRLALEGSRPALKECGQGSEPVVLRGRFGLSSGSVSTRAIFDPAIFVGD